MEQITLHVEAEINPTEELEKVKKAVNNLFGNISITTRPEGEGCNLTGEAAGQDSLIKFRNLLRNDRIRDAARKVLFRKIRGNTIGFYLNKQVAYAGHVSFSEETAESPLGPIRIAITGDNPRQIVEWLAEKTT